METLDEGKAEFEFWKRNEYKNIMNEYHEI